MHDSTQKKSTKKEGKDINFDHGWFFIKNFIRFSPDQNVLELTREKMDPLSLFVEGEEPSTVCDFSGAGKLIDEE